MGRIFVALLVVALVTPMAVSQIVEKPIAGDPIKLDSGLVAGKTLASGVKAYFGVPFAAPPVREFRWKDPQPVQPWKGVYNADRKPPMCMQGMRDHQLNHYFGEETPSEDCLYVNLWAPATARAGQKLPVLVWIYGGGFTQGTINLANYSGEQIAKKGVIYLTIAYRVGVFGFMAHSELSAESPHHSSGNYGLLDLVAGLQWVQRNIAQFGGDPGNVTIMGQSAGSAAVSFLQSSPLAKGLFHRAFGMSASAVVGGAGRQATLQEGERNGKLFETAAKAKSIAQLRVLPGDDLFALQGQGGIRFQRVVDGHFLSATPKQIFDAGKQNDVPVMLGFMHDESSNALRTSKTVDEYKAAARRLYGERADAFLALYPVSSDADVKAAGAKAAREAGMETTMRSWALAQTKTGKSPVFLNVFSRVHPYVPGATFTDHDPATVGAYHTGEVPYWFQTQDAYNMFRLTRNWTAWDRELANKLSDALIAFAKTGDPNTAAIKWPRYDPQSEQMMNFGDTIAVQRMNTKGLDFFQVEQTMNRPTSGGRGRR